MMTEGIFVGKLLIARALNTDKYDQILPLIVHIIDIFALHIC